MSQDAFDFDGAPFQAHSATSREAAEQIEGDAGTLRQHVLKFLQQCGKLGATDEEIQRALKMNPSTERPRRIELRKGGLVVDSGRYRLTRSKRRATVWVVL